LVGAAADERAPTASEASRPVDALTPLVAIVLALGGWLARLPHAAPTGRDQSFAA
jgi:hypothetical protein